MALGHFESKCRAVAASTFDAQPSSLAARVRGFAGSRDRATRWETLQWTDPRPFLREMAEMARMRLKIGAQ